MTTKAAAVPELTASEQILAMLSAQPKAKPKKGLGGMWASGTDSVTEVFETVHTTTCSLHALARQAENHALQGETESAQDLLKLYGIEAEGFAAVEAAKQLKMLLRRG
jgi:hypothetical protein